MSATMNESPSVREKLFGSGDGRTILIVDNFLWIGELIAQGLKRQGYRALSVSDGREAQELILKHGGTNIDLLITELELPLLAGKDLAECYQNKNPAGRVLVMSSYPVGTYQGRNTAYLRKPFSHESLVESIHELLADSETNSNRMDQMSYQNSGHSYESI